MLQQTTIEKLNKIYNRLNGDEETKSYCRLIEEILRAEMPEAKRGKFNLFDYCSKETLRPVLCGIYHDSGFRVASDGHILCVVKEEYPEEYEGRIFGKDGAEIEGRFPSWRSLIPNDSALSTYEPFRVDFDKLKEGFNAWRAKDLAETGKRSKPDHKIAVHIGEHYYDYNNLSKVVDFMKQYDTDVLYVPVKVNPSVCLSGENVCLLMPLGDAGMRYVIEL